MLPADDRQALTDMLEHAREASTLCGGRSRADLDGDRVFQLASRQLIGIVGEAAGRVFDHTRAQHPEIPWHQIIGARNRIAHRYDQVDNEILWQILTTDLPVLIGQLERALAEADA